MKQRQILDIVMALCMPLLMAYSLIGESFHEFCGITVFVLFLIHHWWNRKFYANLFQRKYTLYRSVQTAIDLLLVVILLLQPLSGILMSKYVLTSLSAGKLTALVREIHLCLAYWGYILLSVHAGMHMSGLVTKWKTEAPWALGITGIAGIVGIYSFIKHSFPMYLFLQSSFVFLDFSASRVLFLLEYLSIMILFTILGALLTITLRKTKA